MLSLELGMTVRELYERMSVDELYEWTAYYNCDPFGPWRKDLNAAYICMSMAGTKNSKLKDFMPSFEPKEVPTTEDLSIRMQAFFKGQAGA